MNDLQLLRAYEPVVKYTQGELFFPAAVDQYVAACSLWELAPNRQRRQLAAAGELTAERLSALPEPPAGSTYYLRFQPQPLGALEYRRWLTRADRPAHDDGMHRPGGRTGVGAACSLDDRCVRGTRLYGPGLVGQWAQPPAFRRERRLM